MLKKLLDLLRPPERKRAGLLLGMILIMALLDMAGVASIMPFIAVLGNPELVETNALLNSAFRTANQFGINTTEQFLFLLGLLVFLLPVVSLIFKALTASAQLRFGGPTLDSLNTDLMSLKTMYPKPNQDTIALK